MFDKIKKIRLIDIRDLTIFLIFIPFGWLLRMLYKKDVWLISERPDEARDNGYWFFKYIHDNSLHESTYYIIRKDSSDLSRLINIAPDKIIYHGSLKHYMYYILGRLHISVHLGGGMINDRITGLLEKVKLIKNHKIFLQHGVIKDLIDWLFKKNTRIDLFCCSAQSELDFVRDEFGYEEHQLALTGLCRFDNLYSFKAKKQILLMPTWRDNLKYISTESLAQFRESNYFHIYYSLLNNNKLSALLEEHSYNLIFYPHSNMQPYLKYFDTKASKIIIADKKKHDIEGLLKESELLITDYSSVYFDFAYMKKPCIYYQFDYEDFRKVHWKEGYFNYKTDAFGPVVDNEVDLLAHIIKYIKNRCKLEEEYHDKIDCFFAYHDQNNCKRTYEEILKF